MPARARLLASLLASLVLTTATATAASAVQDPIPVRPDMYFTASVNGSSPAVIKVACPGPVFPGETTHPVTGQSVEADAIVPPSTAPLGYTGSAATAIDVVLTAPTPVTANSAIVLTSFFAPAAIPTTWTVPCSGTGTLSFIPSPGSATAQTLTLSVTFANIAV